MTLHRTSFAALAALLAATAAAADEPGTIRTTGTATRTAWPRVMRVSVVLREEGDDAAGVLAQLASSRERMIAALASIDPPTGSVTMEGLALGEPTDDGSRMRQMVRMQMDEGAEARAPAPTIVSATLTVDIPVEADDPQAAIIRVDALRKKIGEALAVPEGDLTPDEQEAREEMALIYEAYRGQGDPLPGEPQFRFVAVFDEATRDGAAAEAFQNAKSAAESLAKAVGGSLGSICEVTSGAWGGNRSPWVEQQAAYMDIMGAGSASEIRGGEVVVPQFTEAALTISVSARFALR